MSRAQYERDLELVLDQIEEGAGVLDSFCVTLRIPQRDFGNAAWKHALPRVHGHRADIVSVLVHNVTEAFNAAETIDIGILDGDEDVNVDGATLPAAIAIGASERATLVAGSAGYTGVAVSTSPWVVSGTSAGTTGIADVSVTIRYYL